MESGHLVKRRGGAPALFHDPRELEKLLEKYNAGATIVDLGKEYGKDHTTIIYWLKKAGYVGRQRPRQYHRVYQRRVVLHFEKHPDLLKELIKQYVDGEPMTEIELYFHAPKATIIRALIRAGITLRPKGWRKPKPEVIKRPIPVDPEGRNPGKTYDEYLAAAASRGSKAAAYHLGSSQDSN